MFALQILRWNSNLNLKKYYAGFYHSYGTLRKNFGLPNFYSLIRKFRNPQLLADKRNGKTYGWTVRCLKNLKLVYLNQSFLISQIFGRKSKLILFAEKNGIIIRRFFGHLSEKRNNVWKTNRHEIHKGVARKKKKR